MSLHDIRVAVTYQNDSINSRVPDSVVAELVKAALYKTYADPARTDEGILSVTVRPLEHFGDRGDRHYRDQKPEGMAAEEAL